MTGKNETMRTSKQKITPYLTVRDAARAIEFYKEVFGATEELRLLESDGRIGHAEITIGDAVLMLSDEFREIDVIGPQTRGGSTVGLHITVEDVDAVFNRAVAAGSIVRRPVSDEFCGERSGKLVDPFGHVWFIATPTETLTSAELIKRYAALSNEER